MPSIQITGYVNDKFGERVISFPVELGIEYEASGGTVTVGEVTLLGANVPPDLPCDSERVSRIIGSLVTHMRQQITLPGMCRDQIASVCAEDWAERQEAQREGAEIMIPGINHA